MPLRPQLHFSILSSVKNTFIIENHIKYYDYHFPNKMHACLQDRNTIPAQKIILHKLNVQLPSCFLKKKSMQYGQYSKRPDT